MTVLVGLGFGLGLYAWCAAWHRIFGWWDRWREVPSSLDVRAAVRRARGDDRKVARGWTPGDDDRRLDAFAGLSDDDREAALGDLLRYGEFYVREDGDGSRHHVPIPRVEPGV